MPKIGKVTLRYGSEHGRQHDIWYTQKNGFEIRDLPQDMLTLTEFFPRKYETEKALIQDARSAVREYKKKIETEKKVIRYSVKASSELCMNRVDAGHYSGRRKGVSKKIESFSLAGSYIPTATIGIDFDVYKVIDDGSNPEYYKIDMATGEIESRKSTVRKSDKTEIEYTDERYLFFKRISEAMYKMLTEMSVFFDADADQAVKFIEANNRLLSN